MKSAESIVPSKWRIWRHRRYVVAIMAFLGFFNAYCLRVNLSIAIVAMTSDRYEVIENGTAVNIGVTYPSLLAVWARWAPPLERTRLAMIASSGSYFGNVISMPLSAWLSEAFGWRTIFYFFGVLGLVWYTGWMLIVANSPDEDSRISTWELEYIKSSMEIHPDERPQDEYVPWSCIVRSKAVWAICVANFCENWGFYTFLTQLPKFLKDIYSFNLGTSGLLSGLPYLATGIMVQVAGQTADFLLTRKYLTVNQTRKSFNFFGFMAQFVFILTITFVSSSTVTVACLTIAVGLGAFAWAGLSVNPLDIAPQYASIILGISNTFGTLPGILSPILSGYIVSDSPAFEEWRIVFFITAAIYLFGAFFFVLFSSGELQPWAKFKKTESGP
ncbi:sialin-like isoform X1 [Rhynchophorus ferrugineus]|uniref:sialin-like isoform X1 n=2 Tax=Rhynchophorus ferrugineus TaxID=354439 RepID=UPI003FCD85CA